jgi:hypothetical protein
MKRWKQYKEVQVKKYEETRRWRKNGRIGM